MSSLRAVRSALLVLFGLAGVATAGMTLEHMLAQQPPAERIAATDWDVLDATVAVVSTHAATNGEPPRVQLFVNETLRGPQRRSPELWTVWAPFPHDVDWSGGDAEKLIAAWAARPLQGPAVGERFVILGERMADGTFRVSAVGRFPFTEQMLAEARAAVARPR